MTSRSHYRTKFVYVNRIMSDKNHIFVENNPLPSQPEIAEASICWISGRGKYDTPSYKT